MAASPELESSYARDGSSLPSLPPAPSQGSRGGSADGSEYPMQVL